MNETLKRFALILFFSYFIVCVSYSIFSYCLVHPNLVLTSWIPYWSFQTWIWKTLFNNRPLLTSIYILLLTLFFLVYAKCIWLLRKKPILNYLMNRKRFFLYLLLISPLLLSYNALSSDVFNYIFNAKMVLVYHVNPNLIQAQQFADDPWIRFMSNTYGLAPYGYGWTTISFLPFALGLGKFTPTWLIFRLFSVLSVGLLFVTMQRLSWLMKGRALRVWEFGLVFLNPLFVIEVISDAHNDLWMMWPALLAVSFLIPNKNQKFRWLSFLSKLVAAVVLLLASISIKYATLLLIPVLVGLGLVSLLQNQNKLTRFISPSYLSKTINWFELNWPVVAAFLLFLPLLTDRSRQFYPWYLTWVLVWMPFIKSRGIKLGVIVLSFSAMLRYTPWLFTNSFTYPIELYQKLITFVPVVIFAGAYLLFSLKGLIHKSR